ncbi:MAG: ATP-binding cassette domain-containing protein [bacterium]|nr:ATP-binding cassette domain-containing protein [bacterium]
MALLSVHDLLIRLTDPPLLDHVSFQLEENERVCVLGRNGSGKSTFLKAIAGEFQIDGGEISRKPEVRAAYLPQDVPTGLSGKVFDVIASGAKGKDDDWKHLQQTDIVISQLGLDGDARAETLSAGWKRRVLLARGLASDPDVLLLDEPTNHLDIESIRWLENYLSRFRGSLVFVTHDRAFLQRLATRIVEIDRGALLAWNCGYQDYLVRKEDALRIEEMQHRQQDKKIAEETEWLGRSPKARRTRNEGRVRALERMRSERKQRRARLGGAKITMQETADSGDLVIEAEGVTFGYGGEPVIRDFSTTIMRGDKIGVIGPNGAGKTTLLKVLLKELEPQQGGVRHGTKLEIAYFDQLRGQLRFDENVIENVGGGSEFISINGKPKHIYSYLNDYLFTPERARSPIRILSGGERNRVLLAKLFANPSNMLVLDEPTNDLDMETLELLESLLVEYPGTVLLVSHDRAFLNNAVTSVIALEGEGRLAEYVGGYDDWLAQRKTPDDAAEKKINDSKESAPRDTGDSKRLSYNEKRRLQQEYQEVQRLPAAIEQLEAEMNRLNQDLSSPEFYKKEANIVVKAQDRLAELEGELESAYARWQELEAFFENFDLKRIQ